MTKFSKIQLNKNIYDILKMMLPKQGSIEIQRDFPGKIHDWHTHKVDETLLIIEGELDFFYSEKRITCTPGNMIHLPANTTHKSVAADTGCIYAIATEILALENE
ncbi:MULTISPECIES: cupin domain-containing protein [unclassified Bartonella]|uniref:cupin domain-containing protein n=1 Tax=unclassified Bartonella TaxID=2645622 RepID=UPI0023609C09|nr:MULTISPECIES: cupin domain-containing protein [unclassified Bartonella]